MNTEQSQVREFMQAAEQELPEKPTMPSLEVRILRAKLMLEEVLETINDGLGLDAVILPGGMGGSVTHLSIAIAAALDPRSRWCAIHPVDLVKLADGCADTKVVTDGTALACGIDLEPIFAHVMEKNLVKRFPDGKLHKRADGKVIKPDGWTPPDITRLLEEQS